jgi:hypothetical protein
MAPEVWGKKVCGQSDQYSLAATYAELRTGRFPFAADCLAEMMFRHLKGAPELPLDGDERQVLERALSKSPARRFGNCVELVAALAAAVGPEAAAWASVPPVSLPGGTLVPWPDADAAIHTPSVEASRETATAEIPVRPAPPRPAPPAKARPRRRLAALAAAGLAVAAVAAALTWLALGGKGRTTPGADDTPDGGAPAERDRSAEEHQARERETQAQIARARAEEEEREKAVLMLRLLGGRVVRDEARPGRLVVEVDLSNKPVRGADLIYLRGLTSLRVLRLRGTQANDASLEIVRDLRDLEVLDLADTAVTDRGMPHLETLVGLRLLALGRGVGDAGLYHLRNMSDLACLSLHGDKVTDAGLAHLARLRGLQALDLSRTKVKGYGLVELKGLPLLRRLTLDDAPVDNDGLKGLVVLTQLRELSLAGAAVNSGGMKLLSVLTNLQTLNLSRTKTDGSALAELGTMSQITELTLRKTSLAGSAFSSFAKLFPRLQVLDVGENSSLLGSYADSELGYLADLKELTRLRLDGTNVSDTTLTSLKGKLARVTVEK